MRFFIETPLLSGELLGDAVVEGEETVGKVNVLIENVARQLDIGKVPDALYAEGDEPVGDLLRDRLGDGQDRDGGVVGGKIVIQLVHAAHRNAVDGGADDGGGDVEGGVEQETALIEVEVLQQCMAEVTCADHDEAVFVVYAENVADLGAQLHNVVAVALLAKFTEAAQVLSDLRSGDAHALAERAGGNAHDPFGVQLVQIAIVTRKTPDHGVGNLFFLHVFSLLCADSVAFIVQEGKKVVNFFNDLFSAKLCFTLSWKFAIL